MFLEQMTAFPELSGPGTTYVPRKETGDQAQPLAEQPPENEDETELATA
jgi:hypothetical protein